MHGLLEVRGKKHFSSTLEDRHLPLGLSSTAHLLESICIQKLLPTWPHSLQKPSPILLQKGNWVRRIYFGSHHLIYLPVWFFCCFQRQIRIAPIIFSSHPSLSPRVTLPFWFSNFPPSNSTTLLLFVHSYLTVLYKLSHRHTHNALTYFFAVCD